MGWRAIRPRIRARFAVALPLLLLASAGMADAQNFNQFLGFGDSTIDSGFYNELVTTDRVVTTSLTTTTAPSYWMPAVEVGKDWADGTIGARARLNTNVVGLVSFTGEMAQNHVAAYGGEIGMNVAF